MAYEGGYGGQQRPYGGPAPQRDAPQQYGGAPPPQQYGAPQQYNDYQDGYGYEEHNGGHAGNGGYGQDYGEQYQDAGYGRNPPPQQDPYGPGPGRGGRPMPGGRGGGPIHRPMTADGHRNGPYPPRGGMGPGPGRGGPPGRGGIRPAPHGANSDPAANRRPPVNQNPPMSPNHANFGNGYPPFPGQGRRPDIDQEQQIVDQISGMDLNNQRSRTVGRNSSESQRSQGEYGRPPMNGGRGPLPRGYPPQGYPDSRRGPPPAQDPGYGAPGGYGEYGDGHGNGGQNQGPPTNGFGPPARSMTMPVNDNGFGPPGRSMTMPVNDTGRNNRPPPQRMGAMPENSPAGQVIPQRPSTGSGHRPPQRTYTADPRLGAGGEYGNGYNDGQGYRQQSTGSYDDVYDAYFDDQRNGNPAPAPGHHKTKSSLPNFDAIPVQGTRGSFEQTMRPPVEQVQARGPQTAVLNHAKSQPDFRQPQAAVFEMAGDIPSVPPVPQIAAYQPQQNFDQGYGPGGYDQMPPRGASVPPGHPSVTRSSTGSSHSRNPDGLPSHPAPVRPGLMADSMVNLNSKPPPVRNYGGMSTPAPQPVAPLPQQQQQQHQLPPQQPRPKSNNSKASQHDETPVTAQELEHLRQVIKSNPNDQESALRLAKRLVEAADVLVPKLPDPKSRSRARERYLVDSHKILKKLSNAQNSDAMFSMADCNGRGLFGSEPDNKEAFTLYQSAAKIGHPAAAYRTAVCCEIGHEDGGGTRKDPLKAIQWYKRSATLGYPPAMYKVGMILLKGLLGQPKNPREAVGWLKRAAERADAENPHALHELGLLYESAQPSDAYLRDEPYALELFMQAAELGYKFSQYKLGCTYEYGLLGCPIDPRLSIMWYSRAATQEEHQAELALSGWYLTGSENVLTQSDTEAYLWARKAAIAGLAKAEYAMGYFTEVGIGVPANMEDAKRWYWRAAAQDYPKARERLEDLKRAGKNGVRQRERISRSKIEKQQGEGECIVM
ncbi:Fc.00g039990.m01.CDS01 [Cosmosporella sp. VM-42]